MVTNTRKEGRYSKFTGWAVNIHKGCLPSCIRCYRGWIQKMVGLQTTDAVGNQYASSCSNNNSELESWESGRVKLGTVKLTMKNKLKATNKHTAVYKVAI